MKKSKKTVNHTTEKQTQHKYVLFDEYFDFFTLRKSPISIEGIEQMAKELAHWAQHDPEAFKLSQFFSKKGVSGSTVKKWKEKSELFAEAVEFAKQIIGNRREIGALQRKLSEGIVASSMAFYDPDWKEMAEWRASLKQEKDQTTQPVTVVIESYPSSDRVPEKK